MLNSTGATGTVAVGREALEDVTGDYNVAIGYQAGLELTSGATNVSLGVGALASSSASACTASDNTCIGAYAGARITTGAENVLVGKIAGDQLTTGGQNVFIGNAAGTHNKNVTTGSRNIIIGYLADLSAVDGQNQIVMGYDQGCTGDNNFTFGNGASGADSNIAFGATSITAPSDERLKENIATSIAGLSFINDLRPVTFQWKKLKDIPSDHKAYVANSDERVMGRGEKTQHGFIAQEVKAVIDNHSEIKDGFEMWMKEGEADGDGRQRLAPAELIPILVKAVQELSAKVKELEGE